MRFFVFHDLATFRVLGNYAAVSLFLLYFSILSANDVETKDKFISLVSSCLYVSSYLYLAASLMQLASRVTGIDLFHDIVNAVVSADISGRSSASRGMNSIAVEPSYAGIQTSLMSCLAVLLYHMKFMSRSRMIKSVLALLSTAVLSASATVIPFLLIAIYCLLTIFQIYTRIIIVSVGALFVLFIFSVLESIIGLRLFWLLNAFDAGGFMALLDDVSFVSRLASPINYSLPLFVDGKVLGDPFSEFGVESLARTLERSILPQYVKDALFVGLVAEGGGLNTKSAVAQSIFLFGIPAIMFWLLFLSRGARYKINTNSRRNFRRVKSVRRSIVVFIFLGYLIQVPLGHPTFLLCWGILLLTRAGYFLSASYPSEGLNVSPRASAV